VSKWQNVVGATICGFTSEYMSAQFKLIYWNIFAPIREESIVLPAVFGAVSFTASSKTVKVDSINAVINNFIFSVLCCCGSVTLTTESMQIRVLDR